MSIVSESVKLPIQNEKVVYISGPMRGYHELNYPAFFEMEDRLLKLGIYKVLNPARNFSNDSSEDFYTFMRVDLRQVTEATGMVLLPGWRASYGCSREVIVAEACGIRLYDSDLLPLKEETLCEEAERLVYGDRQKEYGHPIEDFTRTGRMWGAILGIPDIPPENVARMMRCLKISRQVHKPKRDNLVDEIGYVLTEHLLSPR